MSKFHCCYRNLQKSDASHAWIELHRLAEAYSRTTGEPFTRVFEQLEQKFNFKREVEHKWPTLEKMLEAGDYLKTSRDTFLTNFNALTAKRKQEKKNGNRHTKDVELIGICHKQNENNKPEVGYWGWEKLRKLSHGDCTKEFIEKCITDRYAFIQQYLLAHCELDKEQLEKLSIHGKTKQLRLAAQHKLGK